MLVLKEEFERRSEELVGRQLQFVRFKLIRNDTRYPFEYFKDKIKIFYTFSARKPRPLGRGSSNVGSVSKKNVMIKTSNGILHCESIARIPIIVLFPS